MKEVLLILVVWSTAIAGAASTDETYLNDTLTVGEGAQRIGLNPAIRTVVIDPGHGGYDSGCSGEHSKEKEIALELSLAFGKLIELRHPDIEVIFTRETDKFVALHERARIANKAQADLFISIHCNALEGHHEVHGSETYVMGLHNADHNLNVAKRENEAVQLEVDVDKNYSFDPNSPAGHIVLSMFQHAFQEQSITAANHIEQRLGERKGRKSRGVRMAGFVVLKETAMPSVLVETGYLSNEKEETYLSDPANQQTTAEALYNGFADYLQELNRAQRTSHSVLASQVNAAVTENEIPLYDPKPNTAASEVFLQVEQVEIPQEGQGYDAPQFYVQLAATKTQIDTDQPKWTSLQAPIRFVREDLFLKYQAGPFATKKDAELASQNAETKGFEGTFIVGYLGAQKMSFNELEAQK